MSEGQCLQVMYTGAFVSDLEKTYSLKAGSEIVLPSSNQHLELLPTSSEPLTSPRTFDGSDSSSASRCNSSSGGDYSLASPSSSDPRSPVSLSALPADLLIQDFLIEGVIGQGRFGSVWRCVEKSTGELFACKQLVKGSFDPQIIFSELECLSKTQHHRNILQLENVYESPDSILILTEMCKAGDLYDHILEKKFLSESEARRLFREVVSAVHHCHAHGVVHRDIKPENILLQTCPTTGQRTVRLGDFGLATVLRAGETAIGAVGSVPYDAPEVADYRPYGSKSDMFSLGVVLFSMLSGRWPHFELGKIFCPKVSFGGFIWNGVSHEARDLMTRLMSHNPGQRPTAEDVLRDPWLSSESASKAHSIAGSPVDHFSREMESFLDVLEASCDEHGSSAAGDDLCVADVAAHLDDVADHHADVAAPCKALQPFMEPEQQEATDWAGAWAVKQEQADMSRNAGKGDDGSTHFDIDVPAKYDVVLRKEEGCDVSSTGFTDSLLSRFCHALCLPVPSQARN